MKKSKDILNSGNATVEWVLDNAIRTFYPYEGCWKVQRQERDLVDLRAVRLSLWEWATDKTLPADFVLENVCATRHCVNPDCQGVYAREIEGLDSSSS